MWINVRYRIEKRKLWIWWHDGAELRKQEEDGAEVCKQWQALNKLDVELTFSHR